jgi:hypothetical protein
MSDRATIPTMSAFTAAANLTVGTNLGQPGNRIIHSMTSDPNERHNLRSATRVTTNKVGMTSVTKVNSSPGTPKR